MAYQFVTASPGGAPVLGYGNTFPTDHVPSGMLFIRTDEGKLYIRESGAWSQLVDESEDSNLSMTGTLTVNGLITANGGLTGAAVTTVGVVTAVGGVRVTSSNAPLLARARVAVTTNEISNLAATPKTLVAAVADKVAVPLYLAISKTASTAHADAAADGNLIVQTSSGTQLGASIEADSFVDTTTAETAYWVPAALKIPHADAGDALELSNDGAEFTDGGSADTAFVVEIVYFLADPSDPGA